LKGAIMGTKNRGSLAADHGREKAKSGGEAQKKRGAQRGDARRSGSSKQRKG
jgi:hypothetical protein